MNEVVNWAEKWNEMQQFYCNLLSSNSVTESKDFWHIKGKFNDVLLHKVPDEYIDNLEVIAIRTEASIKPVFFTSDIVSTLSQIGNTPIRESEYQGKRYVDVFDPDGNVISIKAIS